MSIKQEFEEAFEYEFGIPGLTGDHDISPALWGAKWMAERCARIADDSETASFTAHPGKIIRQLSKDLS